MHYSGFRYRQLSSTFSTFAISFFSLLFFSLLSAWSRITRQILFTHLLLFAQSQSAPVYFVLFLGSPIFYFTFIIVRCHDATTHRRNAPADGGEGAAG